MCACACAFYYGTEEYTCARARSIPHAPRVPRPRYVQLVGEWRACAQLIVLVVRKDLLVLSWQHDGGSDMAVLLVQYVECANGVPLHRTVSESE